MLKFLKKLVPDIYVIFANPDQTQTGVTTLDGYRRHTDNQVDTEGQPMGVLSKFWAYSWTGAMKKYHKFYQLGPYKPF